MSYDDDLAKQLGVYRSPGLGVSWPQLSTQLLAIYADRVAAFDFVPGDWFTRVRDAMANGDVLRLLPPTRVNGSIKVGEIPDWITGDQRHVDAWGEVADVTNKAVVDYARAQAEAGRAELEAAYSNAAFWDRLYTATKFVADLPTNAVKAVGSGVWSVLTTNWLPLVVVGVLALLWFNKGSIARSVGKRVAADA